jgi:hypothetical protein
MTKDEALDRKAENARELGLNYEPDQVPIGYLCENAVGHKYFRWKKPSSVYKPISLYITSPQRKPLSDEEIGAILEDVNAYGTRLYTFARAIEAKLKEKNT